MACSASYSISCLESLLKPTLETLKIFLNFSHFFCFYLFYFLLSSSSCSSSTLLDKYHIIIIFRLILIFNYSSHEHHARLSLIHKSLWLNYKVHRHPLFIFVYLFLVSISSSSGFFFEKYHSFIYSLVAI
jgi:hypothetical protein